jgi:hypothetical protein
MPLQTVVWLLVLFVLAILLVAVLRRMSTLIARTRDLERYQKAVVALDARSAAVIDPLVRELDEARRNALDPTGLTGAIGAAQGELAALAAEGRALATPAPLVSTTVALVAELDRAARAVDMAEHGLNALTAGTRGRDLEAQTSLKRGALNLRHAREAIGRMAREVGALRPMDIVAPSGGGAAPAVSISGYQASGSEDSDGGFEPRM